ncbi:hypothetical protein GLA29479_4635 [Lysobacter antibioticus]|uniref:Uncharacterized protein n=1 Tax=Lysobacter antibioticus TaxID=84531 RepID=A0A0S2E3S7_LYSAN|nr:hypothetical protein GLA29479_4635 [Lysobacter antibioticus]ALN81569.1 hypothetical protein LA76x_3445 [Lysobacter antibioticus]
MYRAGKGVASDDEEFHVARKLVNSFDLVIVRVLFVFE